MFLSAVGTKKNGPPRSQDRTTIPSYRKENFLGFLGGTRRSYEVEGHPIQESCKSELDCGRKENVLGMSEEQ